MVANSSSSAIVVGIDFGTTHSGVSWALNDGLKRIHVITDWSNPSATIADAAKVPSVISYKNGLVDSWGYDVGLKDEAFRWFKILLEHESNYATAAEEVRQCSDLLKKLNKKPEDVVRDYLKQLWAYTKQHIRKRLGYDPCQVGCPVHVVLTVPAMWSDSAKDKTVKAARDAGLPKATQLVIEPEAAAVAKLRDRAEESTLAVDDAFVVCDAGGGTVDLTSYKVNCIKPLQLQECSTGEGKLCGSVFLDICFQKYIATLVGKEKYQGLRDIDKKKMLQMFEYGVKRSFSIERAQNYSVDLRGVEDNEAEGIVDENINLKQNSLRSVFDHICGQVETLVHDQVSQVKSNGLQVKAILLVGGFGSNRYLHHRLELSYSTGDTAVLQVNEAWSAVCRGACMRGLEYADQLLSGQARPTVVSRISRYNYGIAWNIPFDPSKHLPGDRYRCPATNVYKAKSQMHWLLRRGDRVEEGRVLTANIFHQVNELQMCASRLYTFHQVLYYCQEDEPSYRYDQTIRQLCKVDYSFPAQTIHQVTSYESPISGGRWRDVPLQLTVRLGNATLEYAVMYRDNVVGQVKANYVDPY